MWIVLLFLSSNFLHKYGGCKAPISLPLPSLSLYIYFLLFHKYKWKKHSWNWVDWFNAFAQYAIQINRDFSGLCLGRKVSMYCMKRRWEINRSEVTLLKPNKTRRIHLPKYRSRCDPAKAFICIDQQRWYCQKDKDKACLSNFYGIAKKTKQDWVQRNSHHTERIYCYILTGISCFTCSQLTRQYTTSEWLLLTFATYPIIVPRSSTFFNFTHIYQE